MPKYDYYCQENHCTGVLEYELPMFHDVPKCNVCGSLMHQIYIATPAIFKGTGWGSKP